MLLIILMTVSVPVQDDFDVFMAAHDLIYTQLNLWDLQLAQKIISMYIFIWTVPILLLYGKINLLKGYIKPRLSLFIKH